MCILVSVQGVWVSFYLHRAAPSRPPGEDGTKSDGHVILVRTQLASALFTFRRRQR